MRKFFVKKIKQINICKQLFYLFLKKIWKQSFMDITVKIVQCKIKILLLNLNKILAICIKILVTIFAKNNHLQILLIRLLSYYII